VHPTLADDHRGRWLPAGRTTAIVRLIMGSDLPSRRTRTGTVVPVGSRRWAARSGPAATRAAPEPRTGSASAFGTFGELLQGVLPDDVDFLVTLPITRCAYAWFRLEPDAPLRVVPPDRRKALDLARALLHACGSSAGGTLILDSELSPGKGLASSSADLVATARVVGGVLGLQATPAAIEGWLRPIEPTDGVMYPGVVSFEHRRVRLRSFLGGVPALTVVAVDEGGEVDTVAFNRLPKPFGAADKREYAGLLDTMEAAVRAGDLATVGAVATRSAVLNQRLAPKRHLTELCRISDQAGALGVVCAHSGTVSGVLLADDDPRYLQRRAEVQAACARLGGEVSVFHTVSFGRPVAG
jgi:L-threonine kinase